MARTKKEKAQETSAAATPDVPLKKKAEDDKKKRKSSANIEEATSIDESALVEENMTNDVKYLDIFNSDSHPWFMKGVRELQQSKTIYPEKSYGADRTLARVHRDHPTLSFGFADDSGKNVEAYPTMQWESAGLWLDDEGEPCLVVKALFEDGEEPMLLLYKSNFVKSESDIVKECQWCVLDGGKAKKGKSKK